MEKSVLIFGGAGFAGRYLASEFYSYGYKVSISDIRNTGTVARCADFYGCDLLDIKNVEKVIAGVQPTHIVNLAAISGVGLSWRIPQKTVAVNVEGTINILEAARKCDNIPRVLLIGSSEEYDASDKPISEDYPLNASNPYGISKVMQEQFVSIYRKIYGMKIYYVRSFNHTGVGQDESFAIPSWCRQAAEISKSGKSGTMKVGNIDVKRDLSNVKDIVRGYRLIIESDKYDMVFNLGSGKAVSLRGLLEYIISLSEQEITVQADSTLFRPADNPIICCDNSLIKKELGWVPEFDIFDTVKEMFNTYVGR